MLRSAPSSRVVRSGVQLQGIRVDAVGMDGFLIAFGSLVAASIVVPVVIRLVRARAARAAELAIYLEDEARNELRAQHAREQAERPQPVVPMFLPAVGAQAIDAPAGLLAARERLTTFDQPVSAAPADDDDEQHQQAA